ncbi:MAG: hypothetical protein AB1403_14290 [Candidatus Riflebacteria bacterium]
MSDEINGQKTSEEAFSSGKSLCGKHNDQSWCRFVRPFFTTCVVWIVTYGLYIGSLAGNNLARKVNSEVPAIFHLAMGLSRYNVVAALALIYTFGVFYLAKKGNTASEVNWSLFALSIFCLMTLMVFVAIVMPLGACLCSEWMTWDHQPH